MSEQPDIQLSALAKHKPARITDMRGATHEGERAVKRLRDAGFEEDRIIEILHTGPGGGDPLAVRMDNVTMALRRAEAALITVSPQEDSTDER